MTDLNEEIFVVEFLEFLEERRPEGESVGEPLGFVVEADQARLQRLTQKCASLIFGPVDAFLNKEKYFKSFKNNKSKTQINFESHLVCRSFQV